MKAPRQGRGGRKVAGAAVLQEDVTAAITRATFRELAKSGYAALSMEAVARRAGVGKAALYRRWPSKLEMVSSLLTTAGVELAEAPDTGSLRGDVAALLEGMLQVLRRPLVSRIVPDLHAEMRRTPALAAQVRSRLQNERRAVAKRVLQRAIEREELAPGTDVELALDLLGGPLYWRVIVTAQPTPPGYLARLTEMTLGGLRGLSEVAGGQDQQALKHQHVSP